MAITESHPRIKVEIICNGTALKEYDDDENDDSRDTVTRYIEAKSGEEFEVRHTLTKPYPDTAVLFVILLDGKWTRGSFMRPSSFHGQTTDMTVKGANTVIDEEWFLKKFCFSELTIDDSDLGLAGDELMKTLKEMGEIKVEAYAVKNLRDSHHGPRQATMTDLGTIPEKALKGRGTTHSTSLRAPTPVSKGTVLHYEYVDPDKKPFAIYKFKHRSRDALKSLMVIPRSLSPVPLEERDINTLNPEEMRELLKRQKEQEAARKVKLEVKRERPRGHNVPANGDDDDDEVSFVSAKRRKLTVIIDEDGMETIDLT